MTDDLTLFHAFSDELDGFFLLLELLPALFLAIDIEAWQADINIGHQHRESRIEFPTQSLLQNPVRVAHIVATSHDGIKICALKRGFITADELLHNIRNTPSINGKDEANHLVIGWCRQRHWTKPLTKLIGQMSSDIEAVSCS